MNNLNLCLSACQFKPVNLSLANSTRTSDNLLFAKLNSIRSGGDD